MSSSGATRGYGFLEGFLAIHLLEATCQDWWEQGLGGGKTSRSPRNRPQCHVGLLGPTTQRCTPPLHHAPMERFQRRVVEDDAIVGVVPPHHLAKPVVLLLHGHMHVENEVLPDANVVWALRSPGRYPRCPRCRFIQRGCVRGCGRSHLPLSVGTFSSQEFG